MPESLHERSAAEVRAEMGRARMSGVTLARKIGRNHAWLSRRLTGEVAFSLADLEAIAKALDVSVAKFLPLPERAA